MFLYVYSFCLQTYYNLYKLYLDYITKVKKNINKGQERGRIVKRLYQTKNYDTYGCIFWHVFPFHIGAYDIL